MFFYKAVLTQIRDVFPRICGSVLPQCQLRDWSLITERGGGGRLQNGRGGGHEKFYPYEKGGRKKFQPC